MALPITIQPEETQGVSATWSYSWRNTRRKAKQARPYDLPLPYYKYSRHQIKLEHTGVIPYDPGSNMYPTQSHPARRVYTYNPGDTYGSQHYFQNELELAQNRAVDWLRGELGGQASLGIALAQSNQAFAMIAKRSSSLLKFATKLKKFDLGGAWRALEVTPTGLKRLKSQEIKLKKGAKHFASNFLEVHFGWAPLVGDIYDAIETLQSPIPLGKVKGFGSTPFNHLDHWFQYNSIPSRGMVDIFSRHIGKVKVRCGVEVEVNNPNLYLANRLGLTNPALIVYDAIPFSFVLNWFITIEQFLSQFNMFAGLNVRNPWMTVNLSDTCTTSQDYSAPYWGEAGQSLCVSVGNSFVRTNSLPAYSIARKPVILTSPTRAITAVSLLIQKGLKG